MPSLPADAPRPRECHVVKSYPEQEYGFNLHAEIGKRQYIGSVDPDSPAEMAGLKPGDRILAVNGVSIKQEPHKQVVAKIKEDPLQCYLTVIDDDGMNWYTDRKLSVPTDMSVFAQVTDELNGKAVLKQERVVANGNHPVLLADGIADKPLPRLCFLRKVEPGDEYGFNLHAENGKGHFIGTVDNDSIAQRAGLEEGQRIVGVNGSLVFVDTPHKEVVKLIKQQGSSVELLVASPAVDEWYKEHHAGYSFSQAENAVSPPDAAEAHPPVIPARHVEELEKGVSEVAVKNSVAEENGVILSADHEQEEPSESSPAPSPSAIEGHPDKEIPAMFSMSAAELRQQLSKNKKIDKKSEAVSMKEKYRIAQNL